MAPYEQDVKPSIINSKLIKESLLDMYGALWSVYCIHTATRGGLHTGVIGNDTHNRYVCELNNRRTSERNCRGCLSANKCNHRVIFYT